MKNKARVERIITALLPGIKGQAWKRAINPQQAEDFTQEAIVAVLIVFTRFEKKNDEELIKILGRTAKNRIIDCQRKSVTLSRKTAMFEETLISKDDQREVEQRLFIQALADSLSDKARKVLFEYLEPGQKTIKQVEDEEKKKEQAAKKGYFTIKSVKVTKTMIATSLKISSKDVKEAMDEIKFTYYKLRSG